MNTLALKQIQNKLQKVEYPVRLVAVTKYFDLAQTQELIDAGVEAIGENRVEAAELKLPNLSESVEKHFIGKIQSKKIKKIVALFDVIQSVDSNDHLLKIDQVARELNKRIKVLIQFNISEEPQKGGYALSQLKDLKNILKQIEFIEVIGLMGMAVETSDDNVIRSQFKKLCELRDELQKDFPNISELSMGMSSDYEIALLEGATVIRIGSLFFDEAV